MIPTITIKHVTWRLHFFDFFFLPLRAMLIQIDFHIFNYYPRFFTLEHKYDITWYTLGAYAGAECRKKKKNAVRGAHHRSYTEAMCVMCGNLGIVSIVSQVVHFRRVMRIRAQSRYKDIMIWNLKTNAESEIIINLLEQYVLISFHSIYICFVQPSTET